MDQDKGGMDTIAWLGTPNKRFPQDEDGRLIISSDKFIDMFETVISQLEAIKEHLALITEANRNVGRSEKISSKDTACQREHITATSTFPEVGTQTK
jgi:hypothetical protein